MASRWSGTVTLTCSRWIELPRSSAARSKGCCMVAAPGFANAHHSEGPRPNFASRQMRNSAIDCAANLAHQFRQRPRSIEAKDGAEQFRKPGEMFVQVAALTVAVLVVRRPFDKGFGLLVAPAAGCHGIGAEMAGLAGAQALQPDLARCPQKHHEIE